MNQFAENICVSPEGIVSIITLTDCGGLEGGAGQPLGHCKDLATYLSTGLCIQCTLSLSELAHDKSVGKG